MEMLCSSTCGNGWRGPGKNIHKKKKCHDRSGRAVKPVIVRPIRLWRLTILGERQIGGVSSPFQEQGGKRGEKCPAE